MERPPRGSGPPARALTLAGSDSSGGAGLEADLRAFAAAGVAGVAVVSARTVQTAADGVISVDVVGESSFARDLARQLAEVEVHAAKTGMLGSAANVRAVAAAWAGLPLPLVVDPVLRSSSGADLSGPGAVEAYRELLPRVALVTPNLPEARLLAGRDGDAADLARALVAAGAPAALVTGGHGTGDTIDDVLCVGGTLRTFAAPRIPGGTRVHGTGCTLSATIAAHLALGHDLPDAVAAGILAVRARIADSVG